MVFITAIALVEISLNCECLLLEAARWTDLFICRSSGDTVKAVYEY